jgi:hypothetical protein
MFIAEVKNTLNSENTFYNSFYTPAHSTELYRLHVSAFLFLFYFKRYAYGIQLTDNNETWNIMKQGAELRCGKRS